MNGHYGVVSATSGATVTFSLNAITSSGTTTIKSATFTPTGAVPTFSLKAGWVPAPGYAIGASPMYGRAFMYVTMDGSSQSLQGFVALTGSLEQTIDVTAQWSAANSANTLQMDESEVSLLPDAWSNY